MPVYSRVLKLKNVNKKGLCLQAKIARDRFPRGKALFVASVDVEGQTFRFWNCNVSICFDSFQVGCETALRFLFAEPCLLNNQSTYPLLITLVLR